MDMPDEAKDRIQTLLTRMADLEKEIEEEVHRQSDRVIDELTERREQLEADVQAAKDRLRAGLGTWLRQSRARNVLSAPFIYAMVAPIALLDLSFSLYQAVCFRLYRIPRVRRSRFIVIDRHRLPYLNIIEKINCVYCGYANGVLAYATEIASRTEQYWCPIKHAKNVLGAHRRYARFLEYGSDMDLEAAQDRLRSELATRSDVSIPSREIPQ